MVELARHVQRLYPDLPLVLTSGYITPLRRHGSSCCRRVPPLRHCHAFFVASCKLRKDTGQIAKDVAITFKVGPATQLSHPVWSQCTHPRKTAGSGLARRWDRG